MNMRALSCLVSLLFVSLGANASCNPNGCTSKIDRLYITQGGNIYIKPDETASSIVDCTLKSDVYFVLERSHVSFDELYSALLSSKMAEKSLFMRIVNGSSNCQLSYVILND